MMSPPSQSDGTFCAFCLRTEGHSPRCSVVRHGVEETRVSTVPAKTACTSLRRRRMLSHTTNTEVPLTDTRAQLFQVIAELHMMSHVSAVNLEPSSGDASESKGGKCPPGGVDRKADRAPEFRQKSAEHFSARARGCKTDRDYQAVLEDAKAALDAWKRTPVRDEPPLGDPMWRRYIIQSDKQDYELARFYSVDVRYIRKVRKDAA